MTARQPVEFTRKLRGQHEPQRCGNRVQLEDANGSVIELTYPLRVINVDGSDTELFTELNPATVEGQSDLIEITLTLDAGVAYADGDVLADTQEIVNAARAGKTTTLWSIAVLDVDDQGQPFDLYFLRSNTSVGTENAAFAPSDAVAEEFLTRVQVESADYIDLTNSQMAIKEAKDDGMSVLLKPTSGTSLYVAAVSRGTGTYTANGIILKIGFLKE